MKKAKEGFLDEMLYYGICVVTLGFALIVRVVLTTAIKKAIED